MKTKFIKYIDNQLYSGLLNTLKEIYLKAKGDGPHFKYEFFTRSLVSVSPRVRFPPSQKVKDFLDPYVEEYAPLIKRRELVNSYLLQFMNQCDHSDSICHLLDGLVDFGTYIGMEPNPHDLKLIEEFKARPEYGYIKQQLVYKTMGL